MRRLGISVEGATEREFVNRVLRPHFDQHGIIATGIDLRGNVSLDRIKGVLPALFGSFDFVATFYDFYGFKDRGQRTVTQLETAIAGLTGVDRQMRFFPYLQQYEFEALLFAAPVQAVDWLGGTARELAAMRKAVAQCGAPELVNDNAATSPSHRMKALFPRYDKKLHGPEIIELAGLSAIRAQCPRFDDWITCLELLGTRPFPRAINGNSAQAKQRGRCV
ncbi:DUF4276 family protein [Massilia sp. CCM 9210]|uniref:DUF4276 family protein n=1 Tax=Massilia scottii TaxID=3057166 RepID=UPI0027965AA2|nr:DUF4276 family protein [Massilia sp. CCM 9210]MDQ1813089.1 DUF4276 family protein [Massilia sp. CCM 9210]